ncbi:MAG: hypothetical protein LBV28_02135 [Puniceicoccales bacterium]|nr:hypothetical protein [Puniceicoccales bacterium]
MSFFARIAAVAIGAVGAIGAVAIDGTSRVRRCFNTQVRLTKSVRRLAFYDS